MSHLGTRQDMLPTARGISTVHSIDDLRKLLDSSVWGFVVELLIRTRSYDAGLEGAERLSEILQKHKDDISQNEFDEFFKSIHTLKLNMLDKMDLWAEYVAHWESLRESTSYELCYSKPSSVELLEEKEVNLKSEWSLRRSFILRVEDEFVFIHWLYHASRRYELIKRKLDRRFSGRQRKSDFHAAQLDLSEHEIRRRIIEFERIVKSIFVQRSC